MREHLIRILGLTAKATDDQIIKAVEAHDAIASREKRINDKIIEAGGALSRDQAILSITQQDQHDAKIEAAKAAAEKAAAEKPAPKPPTPPKK